MIKNCPMRHENGNCIPAGGFCTANKNICEALLNAYRMGNAQLSKEDTTSDLISRQEAIDALDFEIVHMTAYCDGKNEGNPLAQYNKGLEDGKKAIEALPSAQPEPHEGHWIDKGWNGDWAWQIDGRGNCWRVIECSECGKGVSVESNYCPHCGAKMKGAQNG